MASGVRLGPGPGSWNGPRKDEGMAQEPMYQDWKTRLSGKKLTEL